MKDRLSALLDGDLDEHAMHPVLDGLRRDPKLRKDWDAYCLIGDLIRGERPASSGFVGRVMAELDAEPTLLAPAPTADGALQQRAWQSVMPIAASVMGVAAVGLVAATLYSQDATVAPKVAMQRVATASVVASPALVQVDRGALQVVGDDPYREYVFAHQGVSAGGPMPAAVQYVRTVSDQREGAGR